MPCGVPIGYAWEEDMPPEPAARRYEIVDFDRLPGVACPCGEARRALAGNPHFPGTLHRTRITADAKLHYHRRLTETYYILECRPDAQMQLDDELVAVKPGTCIVIPPGVKHRAVGEMTVLIVVVPEFDPEDEVVVECGQ
jgi:mannose-6-phosphate isomerase-like protein (cupin superfamily)